jgi:predicted flap endonuclease-1-like 5' DNA nuclease
VKVESIEGIGPTTGERLRAVGIFTVEDLLDKGASRAGRTALARMVGVDEATILGWVGAADLMRVPGVGPEYAELLRAAGVASPAELAVRNPEHLAPAVAEAAAASPGIVRRVPSSHEIGAWVAGAAALPAAVDH